MRCPYKKLIALIFIPVIFLNKGMAQLCEGSLGDPVINITFGSSPDLPGPLDATLTNYNYISGSCPDDGAYTIGSSSPACFSSTWHALSQDHTPNDTSGFMMIVNASFAPGDFYIKNVDGLCDNTTYEFAAWILNVLTPDACSFAGIKPNVTFKIETVDGTVLQSYQTGDIPSSAVASWKQYGLYFTTPAGTNTVVIRMTNNAPGGCGNDLVLDDITFRPCGAKIDVQIDNNSDSAFICEDDISSILTFSSTVVPYVSNTTYQWQKSIDNGMSWTDIAGATDKFYKRSRTPGLGIFHYRLAVIQGDFASVPACSRVLSHTLIVSQVKNPVANPTSNSPICEGSPLKFKANDASLYAWNGPANFSSIESFPVIDNAGLPYNGKFFLKIVSAEGCVDTASTTVDIIPGPLVDAGDDENICEGESIRLHGSVTVNNFEWQPALALSSNVLDPIASPSTTTTFILTGDNGICKKSDSLIIVVGLKPLADAGSDKVIIQGDSTTLSGASNIADVDVLWTTNMGASTANNLETTVSPLNSTQYTLTLISKIGCGISKDYVFVKVFKQLYVPNAFTPNGDGLNDTWRIEALAAYPAASLTIYNRFGQLIFSSIGMSGEWNGKFKNKMQPAGAYPYIIDRGNGLPVLKGVVYLIL